MHGACAGGRPAARDPPDADDTDVDAAWRVQRRGWTPRRRGPRVARVARRATSLVGLGVICSSGCGALARRSVTGADGPACGTGRRWRLWTDASVERQVDDGGEMRRAVGRRKPGGGRVPSVTTAAAPDGAGSPDGVRSRGRARLCGFAARMSGEKTPAIFPPGVQGVRHHGERPGPPAGGQPAR